MSGYRRIDLFHPYIILELGQKHSELCQYYSELTSNWLIEILFAYTRKAAHFTWIYPCVNALRCINYPCTAQKSLRCFLVKLCELEVYFWQIQTILRLFRNNAGNCTNLRIPTWRRGGLRADAKYTLLRRSPVMFRKQDWLKISFGIR